LQSDSVFFVIRVTSSQEKIVSDILASKIASKSLPIYSIILVEGMRGYLIAEAESESACRELITNEPHVKGMLSTPVSNEDLDRMLASKQYAQEIDINDIVEFSTGPFKGYKAKVTRIDRSKDEITVELMDVAVPIPVTTKSNSARIIQKAEK